MAPAGLSSLRLSPSINSTSEVKREWELPRLGHSSGSHSNSARCWSRRWRVDW